MIVEARTVRVATVYFHSHGSFSLCKKRLFPCGFLNLPSAHIKKINSALLHLCRTAVPKQVGEMGRATLSTRSFIISA